MALKWRLLIKPQGLSVSVSDAITTTYMGNFGGQFLPGGIGTDVVRIYLLRKLNLPTISVAASILLERVLGLYAHILVALIALAIAKSGVVAIPEKLSWAIVLLFLLYTVGFAISFAPWAEGLLETCSKRFPHLRYLHKALAGVKRYSFVQKQQVHADYFFCIVDAGSGRRHIEFLLRSRSNGFEDFSITTSRFCATHPDTREDTGVGERNW